MLSFFKCRYLPIAMLVKNAIRKNIEHQPAKEAMILLVRVLIKIPPYPTSLFFMIKHRFSFFLYCLSVNSFLILGWLLYAARTQKCLVIREEIEGIKK